MNASSNLFEVVLRARRCSSVTRGGRQYKLSLEVAVGDKNGRIGYASGSGPDAASARAKASRKAKANMFKVPLRKGNRTLHYQLKSKVGAGHILLRPAPPGTGIVAGGAAKPFLELLGIKDVVVKSLGSTSTGNLVRALIGALKSVQTPRQIAAKRGKKLSEVLANMDSIGAIDSKSRDVALDEEKDEKDSRSVDNNKEDAKEEVVA